MKITSRTLSDLSKAWMQRLGLTDWLPRTTVRFGAAEEMAGNVGYCEWSAERKSALVLIAKLPALAQDSPELPVERVLEETLVHELLHIRIEGHRFTPLPYSTQYEAGLNEIAEALCQNSLLPTAAKEKRTRR